MNAETKKGSTPVNIVSRIIKALAVLFRPTSENTKDNHNPAASPRGPEMDGIRFCHSLRHGGTPVRRTFKARGMSAHGHSFEVFQCPACGRFAATTRDAVTGRECILFSGRYYRTDFTPRRQPQHYAAFRSNPAT